MSLLLSVERLNRSIPLELETGKGRAGKAFEHVPLFLLGAGFNPPPNSVCNSTRFRAGSSNLHLVRLSPNLSLACTNASSNLNSLNSSNRAGVVRR